MKTTCVRMIDVEGNTVYQIILGDRELDAVREIQVDRRQAGINHTREKIVKECFLRGLDQMT